MNVRLVLTLSLLGLVVGIGSVTGLIRSGVETIAWMVVAVVCAGVIARQAPGRPFLHGFLAGFVAGVLAPIVQVAFFPQYLAHNPKAVESFQRLPSDVPPRVLVILLTPIVAGVLGVVTGFLAWAAARVLGRKPTAAS